MSKRIWIRIGATATAILLFAMAWWPAGMLRNAIAQDGDDDVAITWPLDGGEVPGPNVLVQWEGPDPEDLPEDEDVTAYLIVDDAADIEEDEPIPDVPGVIRAQTNPAIVPNLEPGEHTVQIVFAGEDAMPLEDLDRPSVTFTVLEPHPAGIYEGTCDDLDPEPIYTLRLVGSGLPEATLRSSEENDDEPLPIGATTAYLVEVSDTTIDVELRDLLEDPHAIQILASEDDDTPIACGDIGGPTFRGTLRIGLAEVEQSGYVGVATLTDRDDQTRVLIELTHDLFEREEATPEASPSATATATIDVTYTPDQPTATWEPSPTETEEPMPTETMYPTATETATMEPTATEAPTEPAEPTPTEMPTETPEPTPTEIENGLPE
ncbi:MAG TPA: hypothetical protein VIL01_02895 [Thermomicrobiales bacterium]